MPGSCVLYVLVPFRATKKVTLHTFLLLRFFELCFALKTSFTARTLEFLFVVAAHELLLEAVKNQFKNIPSRHLKTKTNLIIITLLHGRLAANAQTLQIEHEENACLLLGRLLSPLLAEGFV